MERNRDAEWLNRPSREVRPILDPFYVLLSKAVKSPEKNRILIVQALALFGEKLAVAITKAGGDLKYFTA